MQGEKRAGAFAEINVCRSGTWPRWSLLGRGETRLASVPWRGRNIGNRRAKEREGGPWRAVGVLSGQKGRKIGAAMGKHGKVDVKMRRGADSPKGSRVLRKANDLPVPQMAHGATWLPWAARPAVTSPGRAALTILRDRTVPRCTPCTPCTPWNRDERTSICRAEKKKNVEPDVRYCLLGSSFCRYFASLSPGMPLDAQSEATWNVIFWCDFFCAGGESRTAEAGQPCVIEGPPRFAVAALQGTSTSAALVYGADSMPGTVLCCTFQLFVLRTPATSRDSGKVSAEISKQRRAAFHCLVHCAFGIKQPLLWQSYADSRPCA